MAALFVKATVIDNILTFHRQFRTQDIQHTPLCTGYVQVCDSILHYVQNIFYHAVAVTGAPTNNKLKTLS